MSSEQISLPPAGEPPALPAPPQEVALCSAADPAAEGGERQQMPFRRYASGSLALQAAGRYASGSLALQAAESAEGVLRSASDPLAGASLGAICRRDAGEHCLTCSDEALPAQVLSVDESGLAMVALEDETTLEIDVTLLDAVAPGDWVLVHGGVAIGALDEARHE